MYALLGGNVFLYVQHRLPLVLHVLISAVAIHLAFTVWHEAVHATVSPRAWVNNVVGVFGMLPYKTPYFLQRWVHLEHHDKLNEKDDPNSVYADGPFLTLPFRYFRALGYAKKVLKTDPRTAAERSSDIAGLLVVAAIYGVATWRGFLLDALILWFVPLVIAKLVMDWYINWLPHVGLPPDRFRGTRILEVGWLTPLVLGHNYHAIHHLWPTVPWHGYRSLFKKKRDYLERNDVPIEHAVFRSWRQPVGVDGEDSLAG